MDLYCRSLSQTKRYITREVMIGKVGVGGDNPIRIQSMTTTDTMDTKSTIDQSMRMIDAGCEIVRITAPSIKEARNLEPIKDGLIKMDTWFQLLLIYILLLMLQSWQHLLLKK